MADAYLEEEQETAPKGEKAARDLNDSAKKAALWQRELSASKKWLEKFTRTGKRCEAHYIDDGSQGDDRLVTSNQGKVNLFWSNVQVVLAAIYGRMPKAEVDRRFDDYQDDVSRVAGIIMQRILNGDLEREYDDTAAAMRDACQDRFIVGLGQVWVRYEVETEEAEEPVIDPMTGQPAIDPATGQPLTETVEKIVHEDAPVDYVYWEDFRYSPTRRWRDVRWVARRVYMSKPALMKRFSLSEKEVGSVPFVNRSGESDRDGRTDGDVLRATPFQQAAVWEIWDRESNSVCWYVEGCPFVLDSIPDPLELDDFFPCPQPVTATTLTKAFIPRADYAMAQDLYLELDRINARLSSLTQAVKAAGVYDKNANGVKTLLQTGVENALVPVENWSSFTEKGGMRGVTDWLPIEQFVNAIMQLTQRKAQIERDLYEVLGISDIMRGATVASETATAQALKAQYGGARLTNLQNEVARFVSGVMRIRANIISNLFQPETMVQRSLIDRTPDAQLAQPAIALLKDFGTALYSITVTADSLAAPDWAAEKEARTEFMGAASNFIMASAPVVQQNPALGSFLMKLLQWGAAGFKGSKTIEGVLDQAASQLEQMASQPPSPPQPTPEDKKNEAAAAKNAADAKQSNAKADAQLMENQALAAVTGLVPGGPQPAQQGGMPAPPNQMPGAAMQGNPMPPMPIQ